MSNVVFSNYGGEWMRANAGAIDDKDNIDNEEKEDKPTQADMLVDIGLTNCYLFIDQHGIAYARTVLKPSDNFDSSDTTYAAPFIVEEKEKNNNKKCNNKEADVSAVNAVKYRFATMPLQSSQFKEWIAERMHTLKNKTPGSGSINSAITTLSGIARKRNIRHRLYNRVAPDLDGNGFWIDMCDKDWRVIHITEEGWEIKEKTPVPMFRHFKQGPLPTPVKVKREATAALRLLNFLNLKNDVDRVIAICSIISFFIPEIEHPALNASGPRGSAKSIFFECIKKIIDPLTQNPETETISMSSDELGLAQQLYHIYFPCFDNVSSLTSWKSDMLCRAVTGAGVSKRRLYTDDEDFLYQFYRCIGLNGINVAVRKSDLMDRLILFKFDRFYEFETKQKKVIYAEFENERGKILGAILAILSKAIRLEKEIKLTSHKRLADFHKWGCAISQALGYGVEQFNDAYTRKHDIQNEEVLNASSIALAFIGYLKENFDYVQQESDDGLIKCTLEKTSTEWFREVTGFARKEGIKTSKGYWAGDTSHFVRKLNEIKPNLEKVGITIQSYSDGSSRSLIVDVTELMSKSTRKSKGDSFWDKALEGR